jgi:hypothetical protein
MMWAAQLAMVASLVIFFESTGAVWYFVSQTLLNASLFVVIPFMTGMLSEVDVDGSLVSRTVVVTFIGAGVGTVVAGGQFNDLGGVRFGYAMCAGILVAAPFFEPLRLMSRQRRAYQGLLRRHTDVRALRCLTDRTRATQQLSHVLRAVAREQPSRPFGLTRSESINE